MRAALWCLFWHSKHPDTLALQAPSHSQERTMTACFPIRHSRSACLLGSMHVHPSPIMACMCTHL